MIRKPLSRPFACEAKLYMALPVGSPVKKREMSELNEVDAMTPNTISTIPPARRTSETALLMFFSFC